MPETKKVNLAKSAAASLLAAAFMASPLMGVSSAYASELTNVVDDGHVIEMTADQAKPGNAKQSILARNFDANKPVKIVIVKDGKIVDTIESAQGLASLNLDAIKFDADAKPFKVNLLGTDSTSADPLGVDLAGKKTADAEPAKAEPAKTEPTKTDTIEPVDSPINVEPKDADQSVNDGSDLDPQATVNDEYARSQHALDDINAYEAWDTVKSDHAVTVAIIDTGCNVDHPDLKDNIIVTFNSVDNSTDVHEDLAGNTHGTHVAGIVAATADNGIGVVGVSHNAYILPIKAAHVVDRNGTQKNSFAPQAVINALQFVLNNASLYNIRVVNMSLGSLRTGELGDLDRQIMGLVDDLYAQGVIVVCSAGNNNTDSPYFMSDFNDKLVSVINVYEDGTRYNDPQYGSNYNAPNHRDKDISAPGYNILSTEGDDYAFRKGTSMSAPAVSGVLALMFSLDPTMTSDDATNILYAAATDLDRAGFDEETGYGMVDAAEAVRLVSERNGYTMNVNDEKSVVSSDSAAYTWTWTSDNANVASVDAHGKIKALAGGNATITASDGYHAITRYITVNAPSSDPVNPDPVDPDPTPVDPTPVDPTPVVPDPEPVTPVIDPVDPEPVNPVVPSTHVDPTPVTPEPVKTDVKGGDADLEIYEGGPENYTPEPLVTEQSNPQPAKETTKASNSSTKLSQTGDQLLIAILGVLGFAVLGAVVIAIVRKHD